jgi:phosphoribosylformimino-5-aminoimidazole carboxamide ribotide isomerase
VRIIPVLDLMGGRVVQGIQGQRTRYQSVKSVLTASSAPLAVAQALWSETDCEVLYVADLDAIEGRGNHRPVIQELSAHLPCRLWVDAGVANVESISAWIDAGVDRVVIGSETLESLDNLTAIQAATPPKRLVFSLDMQRGEILSSCRELSALSPITLLGQLAESNWTHVILLALDRVGAGNGPDWPLLEAARQAYPGLALIVGGGVRAFEDLRGLAHLGADGVLVASALHNGRLMKKELHTLTKK